MKIGFHAWHEQFRKTRRALAGFLEILQCRPPENVGMLAQLLGLAGEILRAMRTPRVLRFASQPIH